MGLELNHNTVPSGVPYFMGTGGTYIAKPPATVRQNGQGNDVVAGYASVEWSWPYLTANDFRWWTTTLLNLAPSAVYNHAILYDYNGWLTTYSNCCVHRPTYGHVQGDTFFDVKVVIDMLF